MFTSETHTKEEIGSLIADLSSYNGPTRRRARQSLVASGRLAVAPLVALLSDPRQQTRWEAVKALGEIGDPAAAPALVHTLEDEWSGIRWLAAEGLAAMGREGLEPLLQALAHHSDSKWLREGAHHMLRAMMPKESELVSPVLQALEDIEPVVQVPLAAERALSALNKPSHSDG